MPEKSGKSTINCHGSNLVSLHSDRGACSRFVVGRAPFYLPKSAGKPGVLQTLRENAASSGMHGCNRSGDRQAVCEKVLLLNRPQKVVRIEKLNGRISKENVAARTMHAFGPRERRAIGQQEHPWA
jgi:hypothetical protein